jgi:hypothetical protein
MDLFLQKIWLLLFFSLSMFSSIGQLKISQEISPSQINKDEYATLKIIVQNSNNVQEIIPPSLKNFTVISGPGQESGTSSVNGQVTSYTALVFILKPNKTGKIEVESSVVTIAGKMYKTNTTALLVRNITSGNNLSNNSSVNPFSHFDPFEMSRPSVDFTDYILKKGENVADKVNKNMQLRLETDKTSCFVGEPIVASYKLYTRLKSESKLTENPSFNGFSVIELTNPDIEGYTRQKLNGREYNVYTIRKAQLYPLQHGNIDLESAELENKIQFINDEYINKNGENPLDLFDNFGGTMVPQEGIINQVINLKSKPVTILVKPLPEANRPVSFSGSVGKYFIEAQLQKKSFPVNESGKLIVKISGSGNLPLLTAPVLQWPAGTDPFDPKVIDELDKLTIPVSGSKTFEYGFSVNAPGRYKIPSIQFSYFDPVSAIYRTISTNEIVFTVSDPTGPVAIMPGSSGNKERVSWINSIFDNRGWIIVFIAFIMITALIIWLKKDRKTSGEKNTNTSINHEEILKEEKIIEISTKNQQNPLAQTALCLEQNDCNDFYSLLNTELKNYLSKKFLIDPVEINKKTIFTVLDKQHISNNTVLQLQQLIQEIEWQLYTPYERNGKMNELYSRTHDIIQLINSYDVRNL